MEDGKKKIIFLDESSELKEGGNEQFKETPQFDESNKVAELGDDTKLDSSGVDVVKQDGGDDSSDGGDGADGGDGGDGGSDGLPYEGRVLFLRQPEALPMRSNPLHEVLDAVIAGDLRDGRIANNRQQSLGIALAPNGLEPHLLHDLIDHCPPILGMLGQGAVLEQFVEGIDL